MAELISDIVAREAVEQIDSLIAKIDQAAARVANFARESRSINVEVSGASSIADTARKTDQARTATEALTTSVNELDSSIEDAKKVLKDYSGNVSENARMMARYKAELKTVQDEQKLLNKLHRDKSAEEYTATMAGLIARENELKIALGETTQTLKAQIKEEQAAVGSMDQVSQSLGLMRDAYRRMSAEERNGAPGQALKAAIDQLDPAIKGLDGSIGNFHRNVGNYSGALKTLEGALEDVRRRQEQYGQQTDQNQDVVAALAKEEALLARLVESQAGGFANATMELRKNEAALQALAAAGLKNTEFYEKLLQETAELKDNVGDLKNEIKNLASDTSTLDGLIEGAELLAGAYAVGAGAAEMLGVSQDTLEESQRKFQAVMEVLAGLQAIQNALQKDSSLMLFLNAARTKLLAGAIALKNYVLNGSIGATRGATTATRANTTATNAQTGATVATTAATGAATTALRIFRAALIATGIGAIIVLLTSMAAAAAEFGDAAQGAASDADRLRSSLDDLKDSQDALNNAMNTSMRVLEAKYKAEGKSAKDIFEMQQRFRDSGIKREENYLNNVKDLRNKANRALQQSIMNDDDEDKKKALQDSYNELEKAVAEGEVKLNNLRADYQVAIYDEQARINDENKKAAEKANQDAKRNAQQRLKDQEDAAKKAAEIAKRNRKAQLDLLMLESEDRADAYKAEAEDDNASAAARLASLAKYYNEKRNQIIASANAEAMEEGKTADEVRMIRAKQNSDLARLEQERLNQVTAMLRAELEARKAAFDAYLDHVNDANDRQEVEELGQLLHQLTTKQITLQEYEERRLALNSHYTDLRLRTLADELQTEIDQLEANGEDVTDLQLKLNDVLKALYEEDAKNFAAAEDEKLNKSKQHFQKIYEQAQVYAQISDSLQGISNGLAGIANDRAQAINDQIQANDAAAQKEIDNINKSALAQAEKERRIAAIEAANEVRRRSYEQKALANKRTAARLEKYSNIAAIITNTALAVIKALADYPGPPGVIFAAAAGAVGATQLARAIAAPLPAYAEGTLDHPGDKAIVGDAGKKEVVVEPSGKTYLTPDRPTIMDLPKHTKVFPSIGDYISQLYGQSLYGIGAWGRQKTYDDHRVVDELAGIRKTLKSIDAKPVVAVQQVSFDFNLYSLKHLK